MVTSGNLKSQILEKCSVFPRGRSTAWIDQKFVVVVTIRQCVLGENSSYTNTFKVELEVDRLLFIPLVPFTLLVDEN